MMLPEAQIFGGIDPLISMVSAIAFGGWLLFTSLRMERPCPAEADGGERVYPSTHQERIERFRLLSNENSQLRAELGSIKDRLGNVERIISDTSQSKAN